MAGNKAIINPEIKRIDNRILESTYAIQPDDNLVTIAKRNGLKSWIDLYNMNSKKIGINPDNVVNCVSLKVR